MQKMWRLLHWTTKRRIGKRLGEHEGYIEACLLAKSRITDHIITENHEIGEAQLIREISRSYKLDAVESLFIGMM
jgi:hypothetical protein